MIKLFMSKLILGMGYEVFDGSYHNIGNKTELNIPFLISLIKNEVVFITGPGQYSLTRKLAAILEAIKVIKNLKIYSFDILLHYMPEKSIFVENKLAWVKDNEVILYQLHQIKELKYPSNILINSNPVICCSLESLWNNLDKISLQEGIKIFYNDLY